MSNSAKNYDHHFYSDLEHTSRPSAQLIIPRVQELCTVQSVVDVGCGAGWWLNVCRENGIEDIFGIDGNWIADDQVEPPKDRFLRRELESTYDLDRQFDLAICMEVAEHLSADSAPRLIAELCKLAPIVLFSASVPHQEGPGHINEQWPSYWAKKFADQGYSTIDSLRLPIWNEETVAWWYRQNMVLYASEAALAANPKLSEAASLSPKTPLNLVHPGMHQEIIRRGNAPWRIIMSRRVRQSVRNWFDR